MQAVIPNPPSGGMFGALTERIGGATLMNGGIGQRGGKYLLYALIAGIVIGLAVLLLDQFFPFLPSNPVGGPSAAARAVKTFWRPNDIGDGENLFVPAAESPTTLAGNYAISVQVVVGDSRTPTPGKFRHIVHRGSNPVGIRAATAGTTGHAGIQASELAPDTDPSYTASGLPSLMNPGLFLDKYKNDLHVFVHTKGREEGMDVLWLESVTVEDVPLNQALTVGIVCTGKTLEVYLNCRLYSTYLLKGTPYLPPTNNEWFGRYGAFPVTGLVNQLQLWPSAIGSSDYMRMCGRAGKGFNPAQVPTAACAAPATTTAAPDTTGPQPAGSTSATLLAKPQPK
jgi:hypothetical protein